jgi:hypothetical protein
MNANIKRIFIIGTLVAAAATTGCTTLSASTGGNYGEEGGSGYSKADDILVQMRESSQSGGE